MDDISPLQTHRQEKRVKSMGAAVPGVTHTILLLGGGECGPLGVCVCVRARDHMFTSCRGCVPHLCWDPPTGILRGQNHHGHQRQPLTPRQNPTQQGAAGNTHTHRSNRLFNSSYPSQVMNADSDSILLRRMEFFYQYDIEVWLTKEVNWLLFIYCLSCDGVFDFVSG